MSGLIVLSNEQNIFMYQESVLSYKTKRKAICTTKQSPPRGELNQLSIHDVRNHFNPTSGPTSLSRAFVFHSNDHLDRTHSADVDQRNWLDIIWRRCCRILITSCRSSWKNRTDINQ